MFVIKFLLAEKCNLFNCASLQAGFDTRPFLSWEFRGGGGCQARTETRALLDNADQ